jgi:hypothetical protein
VGDHHRPVVVSHELASLIWSHWASLSSWAWPAASMQLA